MMPDLLMSPEDRAERAEELAREIRSLANKGQDTHALLNAVRILLYTLADPESPVYRGDGAENAMLRDGGIALRYEFERLLADHE